jgi:hypothetical protein
VLFDLEDFSPSYVIYEGEKENERGKIMKKKKWRR